MLLAQHFLHLGQEAPEWWRAGARGCHPCPGLSHQLCQGTMGSVGVTLPVSPPQHQALQGGTRASRTWTVAAVLRALPAHGNFTSTFPLFPIPGKAWEALLPPAVLPFPENSYWEFQHFSNPPSKKHPPLFSSLPGTVTGAGIPPCMVPWQWLALLPTRMFPGAIPACQQLHRAPRCLGRPFTWWLLTHKNTHF